MIQTLQVKKNNAEVPEKIGSGNGCMNGSIMFFGRGL